MTITSIFTRRIAIVAAWATSIISFADASTLKVPNASPAAVAGEAIRSMRLKFLGRSSTNIVASGGSMLIFDTESRPTATLELTTASLTCLIAFKHYADAAETLRSISDDSTVECLTNFAHMTRTHWVVDEFSISRFK